MTSENIMDKIFGDERERVKENEFKWYDEIDIVNDDKSKESIEEVDVRLDLERAWMIAQHTIMEG